LILFNRFTDYLLAAAFLDVRCRCEVTLEKADRQVKKNKPAEHLGCDSHRRFLT
jgi:hypothetical protein